MHDDALPTSNQLAGEDDVIRAEGVATMRDRVPAQALIEQVLLKQAVARRRTRAEQLLGRDPLDTEARPWFAGALGERAVAARLAQLPAGWTVLHSLPAGRSGADIDHLVVGPGGVFTINTRDRVDASHLVAGRTVVVAGSRQPYLARAEAEAHRVDRIIERVVDEPPAVVAVVAVVGARRLAVSARAAQVTVLRAEQLRRFLIAQPQRLTPGQVERLVSVLELPGTWQPAAEAGPELLLAFASVAREVRRAARVRVSWALGVLALTAGGSAAVVLPGLLPLLR